MSRDPGHIRRADKRVSGLRRSVTSLMSFAGSADLFRYRVWGHARLHARFPACPLTDRACPMLLTGQADIVLCQGKT